MIRDENDQNAQTQEQATTLNSGANTTLSQALDDRHTAATIRREILEWRDKHHIAIDLHLCRELPVIMRQIEVEFNKMNVFQSTIGIRKASRELIQPKFEEWLDSESIKLLDDAQKELRSIHDVLVQQSNTGSNIDAEPGFGHISDAVSGLALGLGGFALIAPISSASVVSAGGLMGVLGVTTVSIPFLAAGILLIVSLLALGGHRFATLKHRAQKSYREKVEARMEDFVLSRNRHEFDGLSRRLQNFISQACEDALKEMK